MSRSAASNPSISAPKASSSTKSPFDAKWQNVKSFVATITPSAPGTVCVDLDSVLLYHGSDWVSYRLGHPLHLGRMLTQLLAAKGFRVVVLTARTDGHRKIFHHLRSCGFAVDQVTNTKPPAIAYFDDRAFRIPKNWR